MIAGLGQSLIRAIFVAIARRCASLKRWRIEPASAPRGTSSNRQSCHGGVIAFRPSLRLAVELLAWTPRRARLGRLPTRSGTGGPSADGRHQGWSARICRMATGGVVSSLRGGGCPKRPAELLDVVRRQAGLLAERRPARTQCAAARIRLRAEPVEHGVLVPGHPAEFEVLVDAPAPLQEVVGPGGTRSHVSLRA